MILDRSATQPQTISSTQKACCLRGFSVGILDRLGLVEDDVIKFEILKRKDIPAQRTIGGENYVTSREVVAVAGHAGVIQNPQLRCEALRLLLPVKHQGFRNHDEGRGDWLAAAPQLATHFEKSQHLRRLAHTHIIGQATAERESLEKKDPRQSFALIIAQTAHESLRLCSGL